MKYFCQRLCSGYSKEKKPCEYIDKCDLCIGFSIDENSNEVYMCGMGVADFKCKRDNPNFKPLTKAEFLKMYKKIPIYKRKDMGLSDVLESAIATGLVEK